VYLVGSVKENNLIKMHGVSNFKIVPQLVNKFPAFLKPKDSSPSSQQPATCPYPEPVSSVHALPRDFL
jgi:hypothetical protein